MKRRNVFLTAMIFLMIFSGQSFAQQLTATDTSEKSVKRYRNVIRSNRQLVSFIEYSLSVRGVPKHMRNLAIIESGLDHQIVSHAGASGLWQFMTAHANDYGLSEADRNDIYKSTKTAVSSLINLYNKYGNWITVVAAYNCGEGNIQKAMNRAGSKKYTDFAAYLPAETRGHVKKFLNACYATGELNQVLNDYYKTPVQAQTRKAPAAVAKKVPVKESTPTVANNTKVGFRTTTLNAAYSLDVIAERLQVQKPELLKWNPKIEKTLAERGESIFYLPEQKMLEFELNKNRILTDSLKRMN